MAYKVSYTFEGNARTRPEQNLSGASRKLNRDSLLEKTHNERQKRQEQRLKLRSTEILQSHIRSYLARKHGKEEERTLFDAGSNSLPLDVLLTKFLFFYDPNCDNDRLFHFSNYLLQKSSEILQHFALDKSFSWAMRRYLVICLKSLRNQKLTNISLRSLDVFGNNLSALEYLMRKGYYTILRSLLDMMNENLEHIIALIKRPFLYLGSSIEYETVVISEFSNNFLKPTLTHCVKIVLLPQLKAINIIPFNRLVHHLSTENYFENTNNLCYCVLALQPNDYDSSIEAISVLSALTSNIHFLKLPDSVLSEDSDHEDSMEMGAEELMLADYLHLINNPDKVKKWVNFFNANYENEHVVMLFIKLCYNLLLVYKDSVRKYLLLYKLGLSSIFLNKLWMIVIKKRQTSIHSTAASSISSREYRIALSVFSDMFTFYTETLTDRENSDTSDTFSHKDLYEMSKMYQSMAMELVEMAFPMCRSNMVQSSPEVLHLYTTCLKCTKMLYMLDIRKKFCPLGFWTSKKIHVSHDLGRKNYLSKTIQPFFGIVNENDDEDHLPPLSTIEQRSLAVLQQLPFLIMFTTRVLLLRDLCRCSLGDNEYQRMHNEFFNDNVVIIRRNYLYEDAFEKLSTKSDVEFKHKMRIQFVNSAGLDEAGIDGGGIFKEFLNEVLKTAFDPNRGFFLLTTDNTLYPNPNVEALTENYKEHYRFIGRLVGKAIFENIIVDLPLAEFFLVKLLIGRASAHYLKFLDPVLYRNLLYLRDCTGDVSDLGLDFTTMNNDLGETKVMELKPFGANIPVTNENRLEYIQRLADLKLNIQVEKQCAAFRDGLDSVVPLLWLRLFNHNELQIIVGGDTQEVNLADLRAHTVYGGEFTAEHPTVLLFWRILHNFTDVQRKQLLKFVTSCSRPPLLGFKELNPPFCIQSAGSEDRMPTASTCLNLLKIPLTQDEEVLRRKLLSAIEQQAGFELS